MIYKIDSDILKDVFKSESQKLVGKCMKRFELSDNKEEIKKQVKELIYESMRDELDLIIAHAKNNSEVYLTNSKEIKNG